jgi:hypothetical protein
MREPLNNKTSITGFTLRSENVFNLQNQIKKELKNSSET